jgi:hypothetical protein
MNNPRRVGTAGAGADNRGAASAHMVPATNLHAPHIVPAASLPEAHRWDGLERAAYGALASGQPVVFVGDENGTILICRGLDCCGRRPGAYIVAPDLLAVELAANELDTASAWTIPCVGGRSVHVWLVGELDGGAP